MSQAANDPADKPAKMDFFVAIEGEPHPRPFGAHMDIIAKALLEIIIAETGRGDLVEIFVEDEEIALGPDVIVRETIVDFKLLHAATKGKIKVKIDYGQKSVHREFGPNATMEKILRWAIQPDELAIQAPVEDLQLKQGETVIPAGTHLGSIAQGKKAVELSLVFKIKPQG